MPALFSQRSEGRELVLSPKEHLVAGGPAEQLEREIQASLKLGVQNIFVDLRGVPVIDHAGVRALVRGHTSSERLGRRFSLVAPNQRVRDALRFSTSSRSLRSATQSASLGDAPGRGRASSPAWAWLRLAAGS